MIAKKINWLFFDIGGVLVDESAPTAWRQETAVKVLKEFGVEKTLEDVQAIWPQISGMAGSLDASVFKVFLAKEELVQKAIEKFREQEKLRASYADMVSVRAEALPVLSKIKDKYKLGIIANQGLAIKTKLKSANILEYFFHNTVSQEHGYDKPDPRLFEAVFQETGASPTEAVMIDDNIERGLIPAKKLGMITVWFKLEDRKDVPAGVVDYTITSLDELGGLFL